MRGSPESLAALRHLLAERFPQAAPRPAAVLATGVAAIDEAGDGGLPLGAITEVVALAPSSGGQLLIACLLAATRARRMRAALVDALDAFDPQSHEPPLLQHLVWVRCHTLAEAMHAADILVRDANLALVMLDLRGVEPRALRGVPATTWYRLQRALERTDMAMVVFTAEGRKTEKLGNLPEKLGNRETEKSGNHGPPASGDPTPFRNVGPDPFRQAQGPERVEGLASGPCGLVEGAAWGEQSRAPLSTPLGLVGSARLRLTLAASFQLDTLAGEQTRLILRLSVEVHRRHHEERRIA